MNGLPVFGANLLLHVGPEGDIELLGGHLVPDVAIPALEASIAPDAGVAQDRMDDVARALGYWDPEISGGEASAGVWLFSGADHEASA
jgi:hypothetical protein